MPDPTPLFAIGEVARRAGLTVRALRHYDALGLVVPSARTAAGHRRYSVADVERLQRAVSLRAVGLPLADVARALDGADPAAVLDAHRAFLRRRIAAETAAADRLDGLARHLRQAGAATADTLFSILHLTTMFDTHYTPEQLQALEAQAQAVGPDRMEAVHREWAALFAEAARHREAGRDPAGAEMQALAARAEALVAEFTGGDAGIRQSLTNAVRAEAPAMYAAWGVDPELGAYYSRAMAARAASRR